MACAPLPRLFGGLEQEDGRAVEVAAFTQQLCRAEYGSGVTVMATAVHFALALALVRRIALLFQVDSVHIRTDSDRFAAVTDFQAADNAVPPIPVNTSTPISFSLSATNAGRLYFLKCGFRMRMQLMPPLSQCFAKTDIFIAPVCIVACKMPFLSSFHRKGAISMNQPH